MSLTNIFVPRNRKVDFTVDILIEDLANVPLVTGLFYVKWKLKNAEKTSGSTERAFIKDYSVFWNYNISNTIQLVVGKDGYLMPCELWLTIKQELKGGKEINIIGSLSLNLSEYVGS
ncbi:14486_t:CDS:2, partial [Ambispora leptoticha]